MKNSHVNWGKLLGYLGVFLLSITLSPLMTLISAFLIFYYYKLRPNPQRLKVAIALLITSIVSLFIFMNNGDDTRSDEINSDSATSQISSSSTASSSKAESSSKDDESKTTSRESSKDEEDKQAASESKAPVESSDKEKAEAQSAEKVASETTSTVNTTLNQVQTVPAGETYLTINDNIPFFTDADIASTEAYEAYGELDSLGRVTAANAVLGVELMPEKERGDISSIRPTGWQQAKYANVPGGWLYNRSHLIGHQLTGEDANRQNLMTGTRWFNTEGMLPFENFVANYIEETENHVRYRVTPVFDGDNLLASGIYMEGFSIEDNGQTIQFNIYVPNIQPDVEVNYADGSSIGPEGPRQDETLTNLTESNASGATEAAPTETPAEAPATAAPVAEPAGGDVSAIDANGNGTVTIKEAKAAGFSMPIYSDHWLYPYMTDKDGDGMVGE